MTDKDWKVGDSVTYLPHEGASREIGLIVEFRDKLALVEWKNGLQQGKRTTVALGLLT